MTLRIILAASLVLIMACCSMAEQRSPEYWAHALEETPNESYPELRALLNDMPIEKRRELLSNINRLRGIVEQPEIGPDDYLTFEEGYVRLVKGINQVYAARGAKVLASALEEMKAMQDSPFRYQNGEVVSMIPEFDMTREQQEHLTLIKSAVEFAHGKMLIRDGVPLRLKIEADHIAVLVGARNWTRSDGMRVHDGSIHLDRETGAPASVIGM